MNLSKVIVCDVEATCWEPKPTVRSKEFESEIIEIGLCVVDLTGKSADEFGRIQKKSILVKPRYSKVSAFCTQLTTLTQENVDVGVSLYDACQMIQNEFDSKNYTWASYGDYDRNIFEKECKSKGIFYPFGPRHLNIKNLFALMQGLDREVGLPEALAKLKLPLEGTHHRGHDDAWNIAKVVYSCLRK